MSKIDKYKSITPELAVKLMEALEETSKAFNNLSELSVQIENPQEKIQVLTAIGESIGLLLTNIERPIIRKYPELEPSN